MQNRVTLSAFLCGALVGCGGGASPAPEARTFDALSRAEFNRAAVREDLPLYFRADDDGDGALDPSELAVLRFYPDARPRAAWVGEGGFTAEFVAAYERLVAAAAAPQPTDERLRLVREDLDLGRPTLVWTDFSGLSGDERAFASAMLRAAAGIDALYELQSGVTAVASRLPGDTASASLFRRNRGPRCAASHLEANRTCTAIPGVAKPPVDAYPTAAQAEKDFCAKVAADPELSKPFTVLRERDGALVPVPYTEAYGAQMKVVSDALREARAALKDPAEAPLATYLEAAAQAFLDNRWEPADEAWSKMNAENSKWYVRVAPDETYWEPCALRAGFHMTFARINRASLEWQAKLTPLMADMEARVAVAAGAPYAAREVSFHLPDFIDIVWNAGDDRGPIGATVGQSLPNWGPVADEGRGRTVAMSNLYTDPDSLAARRVQAESVLDAGSMGPYTDDATPSLLSTILHEACHNLGPSHEYKVDGKPATEVFGGPMASVLEELKAQTAGLVLVRLLVEKGVLDQTLANQVYADSFIWAIGHVSHGMYDAEGHRRAYSQLSAIQLGFWMDHGGVRWDPEVTAANGKDKGAFVVDYAKLADGIDALGEVVLGLKSRGDKAVADELAAKYVDGDVVPMGVIAERYKRNPKTSFVYGFEL